VAQTRIRKLFSCTLTRASTIRIGSGVHSAIPLALRCDGGTLNQIQKRRRVAALQICRPLKRALFLIFIVNPGLKAWAIFKCPLTRTITPCLTVGPLPRADPAVKSVSNPQRTWEVRDPIFPDKLYPAVDISRPLT